MNPRRLIEETCDPTEALLLGAVKAEHLSAARRQRILASFGPVGAGLGRPAADAMSTESGSLPASGAGQGGAAVAKASLLHAVSVKWLGLCALALIPVAVVVVRHRGPPAASGSTGASQAVSAATRSTAGAASEVATQELSPVAPAAARLSANPVAAQQDMGRARASAPAPSSLSQEVAALKEVRRTLAQHDPAGALRALDRYARRFAAGRLAPEAAALRIESLAVQGDLAAASALADRFESEHPESPYRARLRSILSAATSR